MKNTLCFAIPLNAKNPHSNQTSNLKVSQENFSITSISTKGGLHRRTVTGPYTQNVVRKRQFDGITGYEHAIAVSERFPLCAKQSFNS
jgi:hypothetical protein